MVKMILSAKQKQGHRHRDKMHGHQWGRGEGMNWDVETDLHTLYVGIKLCIKLVTNENLLYRSGTSTQRSGVT